MKMKNFLRNLERSFVSFLEMSIKVWIASIKPHSGSLGSRLVSINHQSNILKRFVAFLVLLLSLLAPRGDCCRFRRFHCVNAEQ